MSRQLGENVQKLEINEEDIKIQKKVMKKASGFTGQEKCKYYYNY